jgi:hypothetical protein
MIIVYDISNEESFSDLEGYIKEGVRYSERSEKFIVGNKVSLVYSRISSLNELGFFYFLIWGGTRASFW